MTALNLAAVQALAAQAAATGPDMTQVVKGGGGARTLPDGNAFGRLVEYVEFGKQPQEYQGQKKDPAMEFQLGFALSGAAPDPANPGQFIPYSNEDGTPYILRTFSMAMSQNEKAKAFLLFKALNWKNKATHFAQLLGEAFIVPIYQHQPKTPGSKPRSAIRLTGIMPPLDLMSQQPYNIAPARDEDLRIFLWDHPMIEHWDALKIEGEYENAETKQKVSKNYLQETILQATNFEGSPLQMLLAQHNRSYSIPKPQAVPAAVAPPTAPVSAPAVVAAPAPVAPVTVAPAPIVAASTPVVAPQPVVASGATAQQTPSATQTVQPNTPPFDVSNAPSTASSTANPVVAPVVVPVVNPVLPPAV